MANLTIKKIDERVLERLRTQARKRKKSLNAHVKEVLSGTVGLEPGVEVFTDLTHLAGSWSEKEAAEFRKNTRIFERIDKELWG